MKTKRNWFLNLDIEGQENEENSRYLRFPLYVNIYEEAIRNIFLHIFRREKEIKEYEGTPFFYESSRDVSNILSFIGERGSGKTTVMSEFCQILDNINKETDRKWWVEKTLLDEDLKIAMLSKKAFFKVMRPIDASCLEAKEDLFELILANIYREFEKTYEGQNISFSDDEYQQKNISRRFERIMKAYHAVKQARKEDFGDSDIARLKYMSSSMEIKEEIGKLIHELLEIWSEGKSIEAFLVISIDDLDLNINNGYDMLEQLHKYFFADHIIITLAIDYEQLHAICETNYIIKFGKKFPGDNTFLHELSQKLSRDYLLKVLPINSRFFVPDMKKMSRRVVVKEGKYKETDLIKFFLMKKIADRMQIFYDSCGLKSHFCEAKTVRELVTYNQFLDSLNEIDFEMWASMEITDPAKQELMLRYDKNHERFNWDIMKRMARWTLNEEYRRIFDELLRQDLERRALQVCGMAKPRIEEKEEGKELKERKVRKEPLDLSQICGEGEYSYGRFLECIYKLGRVSNEDKELIKCLLASFTCEMARENISFLMNPDEKARERAENRLKKFIGRTFGSSWTASMVPLIADGKRTFGYTENVELSRIKIEFQLNDECMREILMEISIGEDINYYDTINNLFDLMLVQRVVPTLECLSMFFAVKQGAGQGFGKMDFRITFQDTQMIVCGENREGILDIMGFVSETLQYAKKMELMQERIAKALRRGILELFRENGRDLDDERVRVDDWALKFVKTTSIGCEQKDEVHIAFPFYDVDLAYNIIKRAKRELEEENPTEIAKDECYKYVKKVYNKIWELLKNQEKICGRGCNYANEFSQTPFIKVFNGPASGLNPKFGDMLGQCFFDVSTPKEVENFDLPEG